MLELSDVKEKLKRKNQILFSRESACLQGLLCEIRKCNHRTIALWALECAEEIAAKFKQIYPQEQRLMQAVVLCRAWASGDIKMAEAKRGILQAHAVAKVLENPADIALCHAVGQGCASVHVETHAIGLPMYELTAIVRQLGFDNCTMAIEEKINQYIRHLKECDEKTQTQNYKWASFLMKDNVPNKEQILYNKQNLALNKN